MSTETRKSESVIITGRKVLMGFAGLVYAVFMGYIVGRIAAGNDINISLAGNNIGLGSVVMLASLGLIFIVGFLSGEPKK